MPGFLDIEPHAQHRDGFDPEPPPPRRRDAGLLRTLTLAFAALHFLDPAPLGRGPRAPRVDARQCAARSKERAARAAATQRRRLAHVEAAWALHIHEERVGRLHEPLELVAALLELARILCFDCGLVHEKLSGAVRLLRSQQEIDARLLGREHPDTLSS